MRKLPDWISAGDIKCGTWGKVFENKRPLCFQERNQHVDPGNCNICHRHFTREVKAEQPHREDRTYGSEKQSRTYRVKLVEKRCGREVT